VNRTSAPGQPRKLIGPEKGLGCKSSSFRNSSSFTRSGYARQGNRGVRENS